MKGRRPEGDGGPGPEDTLRTALANPLRYAGELL